MSIPDRGVFLFVASMMSGCGLSRPPDPPPFDCSAIDRAAERFPERCGPSDAGVGDADEEGAPDA
jgi:hypothetical protein